MAKYYFSASLCQLITDENYKIKELPEDAIEITEREYRIHCGGRKLKADENGRPVFAHSTNPTREQKMIGLLSITASHLDNIAREKGYSDLASAISFEDDPFAKQFNKDGFAFRIWRGKIYDYLLEQFRLYDEGKRKLKDFPEYFIEEYDHIKLEFDENNTLDVNKKFLRPVSEEVDYIHGDFEEEHKDDTSMSISVNPDTPTPDTPPAGGGE